MSSSLRSPMWLAHHREGQLHRCSVVGGTHVCRRCLWAYPACFAVLGLSVFGIHWPAGWDAVLGWGLPLLAVADFALENLGRVRYSRHRQAWFSLLAGIAFGRGSARYVEHPGDRLFWSVALTYGTVMAVSAAWPRLRRRAAEQRELQRRDDAEWSALEQKLFGS